MSKYGRYASTSYSDGDCTCTVYPSSSNLQNGWIQVPLCYNIQFPINTDLCQRFVAVGNTISGSESRYDLLVYMTDSTFVSTATNLKPRTEMRIADFEKLYTGAYKIEADFMTLCGTSYVSIMQVKLANGLKNAFGTTTCFMLWVIDGNLHYYDSPQVIFRNVCDGFHHITLQYNSDTTKIDIWVDYKHVFTVASECASNLLRYFKLGVYTQGQDGNRVSSKSEVVFKNVQLLYNPNPPISESPTFGVTFRPTVPSTNPTTTTTSLRPLAKPSLVPTMSPMPSLAPSSYLSVIPSMRPTSAMPSTAPSIKPTPPSSVLPSIMPTTAPSIKPTSST
eukprot:gene37798-51020_t